MISYLFEENFSKKDRFYGNHIYRCLFFSSFEYNFYFFLFTGGVEIWNRFQQSNKGGDIYTFFSSMCWGIIVKVLKSVSYFSRDSLVNEVGCFNWVGFYCNNFKIFKSQLNPRILIILWSSPNMIFSTYCKSYFLRIFSKKIQKDLYTQTFVSPLKYRLPVPNTDWGRFLPRLQQQSPLFFWWGWLLWTLCQ